MIGKNSVDKIVDTYFKSIARVPFYYAGKFYEPRPLQLSPKLFRHDVCNPNCGGCCKRYELTFLPSEPRPDSVHIREQRVHFDGRVYTIYVDSQDHDDYYCRHLQKDNGLCGIHDVHPMSCDFELMRFMQYSEHTALMTRAYGRAWAMLRVVDGKRGGLCEIEESQTPEQQADMVRRLRRLQEWADYFELKSWMPEIIAWAESGPHDEPLILLPEGIA